MEYKLIYMHLCGSATDHSNEGEAVPMEIRRQAMTNLSISGGRFGESEEKNVHRRIFINSPFTPPDFVTEILKKEI